MSERKTVRPWVREITCTPTCLSADGMNHTCLRLFSRSWYSFSILGCVRWVILSKTIHAADQSMRSTRWIDDIIFNNTIFTELVYRRLNIGLHQKCHRWLLGGWTGRDVMHSGRGFCPCELKFVIYKQTYESTQMSHVDVHGVPLKTLYFRL